MLIRQKYTPQPIYKTYTNLPDISSSKTGLLPWQKTFIFAAVGLILTGFYLSAVTAGIIFLGVISAIYVLDVFFYLFLIVKSIHTPCEIKISAREIKTLKSNNEPVIYSESIFTPHEIQISELLPNLDSLASGINIHGSNVRHMRPLPEIDTKTNKLPIYTILCPLYKESEVIPQFVKAISKLDWPKDKLDVLLLLEQDDKDSINAVKNMRLPGFINVIIVPHSLPKTKPKACNYGLLYAKGEYLVIYDAEDRPDPLQLKCAYLTFQKVERKIVCLQAKLNYYNAGQNLLTRVFAAEYALWFDTILPGLQSINTIIPLGGTSNHFRTEDLKKLYGWDAFNVTEDADLGVRLFKAGFKTAIIDSTTYEEANSHMGNWVRQRSRWIKGYMQTYLVHSRNPLDFVKKNGIHALWFQLTFGGKIAFIFINPLLWLTTILYFTVNSLTGTFIENLYLPAILYLGVISLIAGNFSHIYFYMVGCAKRRQWHLMKFVFFVPFYWVAVSFAGTRALYQLIANPHYWEKTIHGLHKTYENAQKLNDGLETDDASQLPAPVTRPVMSPVTA